MNSMATFFIETACVTGISPLGMVVGTRPAPARQASRDEAASAEDRFVDELLATFGDRWEW